MERRFKTPLWVEIVYRLLHWAHGKVECRTSDRLMWWSNRLVDRHCYCEKCKERKRTGAP